MTCTSLDTKKPVVRCAIYTRKSTEEGLDQQFNSLDNQRLAGESYVASQASEGWEVIPKHYDDGGYSGGSTSRPGVQELFRDIEAGLIDCVVVYKIDRLTRSILDFAKIIELFDKYNVSFVAVTQSFNTSTSIGRLMLNIILSFAQYEREIAGERIRHKIMTSKQLGYWTGGYAPLGYDIRDKALQINEVAAKTVQYIFETFTDLKSITALLEHLKPLNIQTKLGKAPCKNGLRKILTNPIYKGYVQHKGVEYKGRHEAIVSTKMFETVQGIFEKASISKQHNESDVLLRDIIRCGCCDCAMTPTRCDKRNKKYRYYTCSNHIRKKSCASQNKNVPAGAVEEFTVKALRKLLTDPATTALTVHKLAADGIPLEVAQQALKDINRVWQTLHFQEQRKILEQMIKNVVVDSSGCRILLNHEGIHTLIKERTA
jgi:DNA invertase Pin-like site-specific DNA recombinase